MDPKIRNDPLRFGYYFVAFIDVLNQREALQAFKELPGTDKEKAAFIQFAKRTFGVVDGIRSLFDEFFAEYQKTSDLDQKAPAEFRRLLERVRNVTVSSQRFMDTIIIYVPLADNEDSLPISGIYSSLLACGSTFLCSLAANHALRGGDRGGTGS